MKKITLKLKLSDLNSIMPHIASVIASPAKWGYEDTYHDKHILASLGELYAKLEGDRSIFKTDYKLKVAISQAMGFLIHFSAMPNGAIPPAEGIVVNKIIALIDQQTK